MVNEAGDDDAWQVARQAEELLDRRRVPQARALLARALQRDPGHPRLLLESARADYIEDAYGRARQTLGELLATVPDDVGARWLLCLVEMADGRLPEAEELVLGLLRESPGVAAFWAGYSRLMLRALLFEKARALADEALRLAPDDDSALRAAALCDMVDRPRSRDSAAMARLIAADPDDVHTLHLVVVALANAQRLGEARRLAQELLRAQPDDPQMLSLLHQLRLQTHWTLWPLRPLQRWGWYASVGLWVFAIVGLQVLQRTAPAMAGPATMVLLAYVIYSWVWPPLLRRWLERH